MIYCSTCSAAQTVRRNVAGNIFGIKAGLRSREYLCAFQNYFYKHSCKRMIDFLAFMTLFPQLIAGPVLRYKDLADQFISRTHTLDKFSQGAYRFKYLAVTDVFGLRQCCSEQHPHRLSCLNVHSNVNDRQLHKYLS